MLKLLGLVIAALMVLAALGYTHKTYLPRQRVARFLRNRGIEFVRITGADSYGWPAYVIVFDSAELSAAFRQSSVFEDLILEVQAMHRSLAVEHGFDARRAVQLEPTSR